MAQRHAHSQPIETYGPAPAERHIIETYGHTIAGRRRRRHAWPILLFALVPPVYPLLPVFSSVLLAHLGVLLRLVCRRVRFWVLFYTSSLTLEFVRSFRPASRLSHSYADNVQAYKHCLASYARSAIVSVSRATGLLNEWMSSNRIRLNLLKTQYIWLGTHQQLSKLGLVSLLHEFPTFVFFTSVRDLGVILDQELSFAEHISSLTRSCFYQLRQLRVVSSSLSSSSTATLVHAFIINRLDYCSSLCPGLPYVRMRPLDGVLRVAARLIGRVPKFGHIGDFIWDNLYG